MVSLLDKYDPMFDLTYLAVPPYDTANEVAETIDIAIAKAFKEKQDGNIQTTNDA